MQICEKKSLAMLSFMHCEMCQNEGHNTMQVRITLSRDVLEQWFSKWGPPGGAAGRWKKKLKQLFFNPLWHSVALRQQTTLLDLTLAL